MGWDQINFSIMSFHEKAGLLFVVVVLTFFRVTYYTDAFFVVLVAKYGAKLLTLKNLRYV